MNLEYIKHEFDNRHIFGSDDFNILKNYWPNIKFYLIPDAWLVIIDNMLRHIDTSCIFEVRQEYGQLIIIKNNNKDAKIINNTERLIKMLDIDLYECFEHFSGSGIWH